MAPYREGLVVAVECLLPWYGLAALWAPEGMAVVLGHALSLTAMHGGTAQNERSDAQKSASVRRGGLLPQASVSPAPRRAPRDRCRRRPHLRRKRAALVAPVQKTPSQDHLPESGKTHVQGGVVHGGEFCSVAAP
jgi:hypothetical protein